MLQYREYIRAAVSDEGREKLKDKGKGAGIEFQSEQTSSESHCSFDSSCSIFLA